MLEVHPAQPVDLCCPIRTRLQHNGYVRVQTLGRIEIRSDIHFFCVVHHNDIIFSIQIYTLSQISQTSIVDYKYNLKPSSRRMSSRHHFLRTTAAACLLRAYRTRATPHVGLSPVRCWLRIRRLPECAKSYIVPLRPQMQALRACRGNANSRVPFVKINQHATSTEYACD